MTFHNVGLRRGLNTQEVVARTGVTNRRLLYWVEHGVVTPSLHRGIGQGHQHRWSESDVARVGHIRDLMAAGLSLKAAGRVADRGGVAQVLQSLMAASGGASGGFDG